MGGGKDCLSKEIEQKVVEMQFDNSNFEKNVQTSMNTLERLKLALDMSKSEKTFNDLSNTANGIRFDGLTSSIETISDRFSTMGIVGMTVIQNITSSLMSGVAKIASSVKNLIVDGGLSRALNIEQAKFQLAGLGIAWKDIEDDINYGVKDTAYGLDVAAKAASVLSASNVKIGDEMKTALRGISGVAAMTNSDYDSIANIFETVAGQGKIMTQQLRMLESRGLNAAAVIGKQLGKTEQQIRDMVSDGVIDFKTFSTAMDSAFGEHAKDANKTYTGALANVKAALARVGAKFATPGLEYLRQVFVELIPVIDNVSSSLNSFVSISENVMSKLSSGVQNAFGYIRLLQSGRSLTDTIFGNIDTDDRQVIKWTDENLKKYKKELEDWGQDADSIKGKLSTVLGAYSTVTTAKGKNLNIAFSPMLQTKEGAKLLSSDTVNKYINEVVKKANTNTTKENILKLDTQGIEVDGIKIKNLIADVGDTAKETSQLMHFSGKDGSLMGMSKSSINLIETLFNLLRSAKNIGQNAVNSIKPFFDVLRNSFDGSLSEQILFVSKCILNFSESFGLSDKTLNHVVSVFEVIVNLFKDTIPKALTIASNAFIGLRTIINIVKDAWNQVFGNDIFNTGFHGLLNFRDMVSSLSTHLVELSERLILNRDKADSFREHMVSFFTLIKNGVEYIRTFGGRISGWGVIFSKIGEKLMNFSLILKETFSNHNLDTSKISAFINKLKNAVDPIELVATIIVSVFEGLGKIVASIMPYIVSAFTKLGSCCKGFLSSLREAFGSADSGKAMEIINGGLLATLLVQSRYLINTLTGWFKQFKPQFSLMFNELKDSLIAYQKSVKVDILLSSAAAIALLAGSCLILSGIDQDKLQGSVNIILEMMTGLTFAVGVLTGVLWYFEDIAKKTDKNYKKISTGMADMFRSFGKASELRAIGDTIMKMAGSVLMLSIALKIISDINPAAMWSSVGAIVVLLGALTTCAILLSKFQGNNTKVISGIMSMAVAVDILAIAVKSLGSMSFGDLAKGIGAIIVLLASLMGVFIGLSKFSDTDTIKSVSSLMTLSTALLILSASVKILGSMPLGDIAKGEGAIAGLLTMIVTFCGITQKLEINNMSKVGSALIAFSVAIGIMAVSMKILGSMEWKDIAQGSLAIGSLLAVIGVFSKCMDSVSNIGGIASALIIFSAAIGIMAISMKILSTIEFEDAGTAILSIVSLITIFGVFAGYAQNLNGLPAIAAAIVIFAAAIAILVPPLILLSSIPAQNLITAILGIAMVIAILAASATALESCLPAMLTLSGVLAVLGLACTLAGAGLLMMGLGLGAIATAVTASGGAILAFVGSIIGLIPMIITEIGLGIVQLLKVFIDAAPVLLEAVTVLLDVLLTAAIELLPKVNILITQLIVNVCAILVDAATTIANAVFAIIIAVLDVIATNIYQVVDLASEIIIQFLEGIADNLPDIIQAGLDVVLAFLDGIGNSIGQIADAGFDLIIDFIDGISDSIEKNHERLHTSIVGLINTICTTAVEEMASLPEEFLSIGGNVIQGLIDGLNNMLTSLANTAADIGSTLLNKAKSVLGINSPSKEFFEIGMFGMLGWANGISQYSNVVSNSIANVADSIIKSASGFASKLAVIVDEGLEYSPTIVPVLDTSLIQNGVDDINDIFNSQSIGLMANMNGISKMMQERNSSTGNDDVVDAVNTLRKAIENNPNNIYNVGDVSYDDGTAVSDAVSMLINEIIVGGRV